MDDSIEIEKFKANFPKELYLLCESGSGTYGFRTPESDLDLRGVFIERTDDILKLNKPNPVNEGFNTDKTVDWQIFEIQKFLELIVKSNYNLLEWIYTPIKYMDNSNGELLKIADKSLSKDIGNHVRGWAYSIYKMNWENPKKCLYAIRPLMCYIHLIESREFVSDINILADKIGYKSHIENLISKHKRKLNTGEHLIEENVKLYDILAKESKEKEKGCWLPDKSESRDLANAFLLKIRKERLSDTLRDKSGEHHDGR